LSLTRDYSSECTHSVPNGTCRLVPASSYTVILYCL